MSKITENKRNFVKVYFAHPFNGDVRNIERVERLIRKTVLRADERIVPVSPLHALGFMYKDVDYDYGMDMCLALLSDCDVLALCNDCWTSVGTRIEKQFAEENGIKIIELEGDE